jgi:hypothetical protein
MWNLVKFILLLQFFIISSSSSSLTRGDESVIDDALPNIWDDENVTRMVREVIARDLQRENENIRLKRQYKRDLTSKVAVAANVTQESTRKISAPNVSEKALKKPPKVIQTKNRVSVITPTTTRASVRPSLNPVIASNANFGNINVVDAKNKVRIIIMCVRI